LSLLAGSAADSGGPQKENEMIGTVKFFNDAKGYGFIAPDGGGNDAFVHISAVEKSGLQTLRENQRVSYELQEDRRGKMAAVNLKSADDATQDEPQASSDEQAE
jgi:CspA family cold shock protein